MKNSDKAKFRLQVEESPRNQRGHNETDDNIASALRTLRSVKDIHELKKLNFET